MPKTTDNLAAESAPSLVSDSPRDWVVDAPYENGSHRNRCVQCVQWFTGHKRRLVCKVCDDANRAAWNALAPEQQNDLRRQREAEFLSWMMGQSQSVPVLPQGD